MKKGLFQIQHFPFSLLIFISISIFCLTIPCALSANQNMVHMGLVGEMDIYGEFYALQIWSREEIRDESQVQVIYAGCATSSGILIVDMYDQSVASFIPLGSCYDLKIESTNQGESCNIFIAGGRGGLYIINADNPRKPIFWAQYNTSGIAKGVSVKEDHIFVADGDGGLQVIDFTSGKMPRIVGYCNTPGFAENVTLKEDCAYVADGKDGLQIINISIRNEPRILGSCKTINYATDVSVKEDYAYVADGSGLRVIDISDPADPNIVGSCDTPGFARNVEIDGNYAYVADDESSLQIIDITDRQNPEIIGGCITPGGAADVVIRGNEAYIAGKRGHFQRIDISQKAGPRSVGQCPTRYASDIFVDGNYAYIADGKNGLKIIDIRDREHPEDIGEYKIPFGIAYGVTVSDDHAYVADWESGTLQIIDISDKSDPQYKGSCDIEIGTYHVAADDEYAYVTDWDMGLTIVNITDKEDPNIVGKCKTPGTAYDLALDGNYVYIADDTVGLQIIDISDRTDPKPLASCQIPGTIVGVNISGNYAFVVALTKGLHIIDISDKVNPEIVGSHDIPGYVVDVTVVGNYAYIADNLNGLWISDITHKDAPLSLGSCGTPGYPLAVAIEGDYAFIADGEKGLQVIDIHRKDGPKLTADYGASYVAYDVAISGDYAYVCGGSEGLQIIDTSNQNGLEILGSCPAVGIPQAIAIGGEYAYIANLESGLQVIRISNLEEPELISICQTPGYATDVAAADDYAYVTDGNFQIIQISDPNNIQIVGSCNTPSARFVAVDGNYAYVINAYDENVYDESSKKASLLQVIDIHDKENPQVLSKFKTSDKATGISIEGDYIYIINTYDVYVFNEDNQKVRKFYTNIEILDINDKNNPQLAGNINNIEGDAKGITVAGEYAYISNGDYGIRVIDISNPAEPDLVGEFDTPGHAFSVEVIGDVVYVADGGFGLLKLKVNVGMTPKGNLILVAGSGTDLENALWISAQSKTTQQYQKCIEQDLAVQALANHVYHTFIQNGYECSDIWYQNPVFSQDPDHDGSINQLVVDDPSPTKAEFLDAIIDWAREMPNTGPLYIYLMGHGAEDRFQIMPNEVLTAQELKEGIHKFQNGYIDADTNTIYEGAHRQVVVLIESAVSGTFIDDLIGDDITVITSTGEGPSYIKPNFFDSHKPNSAPAPPGQQIKAYHSFSTAFIHDMGPKINFQDLSGQSPDINLSYLKEAFISLRDIMKSWTAQGMPFADQAPQMVLPGSAITSLGFSEDGNTPISDLMMDQNETYHLTLIGKNSNGEWNPFHIPCLFFPSDPSIIDPYDPECIKMVINDQGIPWYEIKPKKNGRLVLIGHTDPQSTDFFLSAVLHIEVSIDDPAYLAGKGKRAVIIAGYKGTGDYLWESTNTIANHAYRTLRTMGYAKDEIFYYSPYILQDLEGQGGFDEICGYPHMNVLNPLLPDSAFGQILQTGATDLLLFITDHGNYGSFRMNPIESLQSGLLIEWIEAIANHVDNKIIFLYDACHSGSFLRNIEQEKATNEILAEKLLAITSTDPNQSAYFLNQGLVSFSYPFFEEWSLTHSLMDAFDYAVQFLPREGQTPLISDPNVIRIWDQEKIYYKDESSPVIYAPQVSRTEGRLAIKVEVYSLVGIDQVWAMIETSHQGEMARSGRPITDAIELYLSRDSDPNDPYWGSYSLVIQDPCPDETHYNLSIYAKGKGERPKVTARQVMIGSALENRTKAIILSSEPELFPVDQGKRLSNQIDRAEAILKTKGLTDLDIKRINSLADIEIPLLNEEQTLFLYLIGMARQNGEGLRFFFNSNESLSPNELEQMIDANQRLLILMDAPYAGQFLSQIHWQEKENWVGIASTDQGDLFFPLREKDKRFPCFSNFFFSQIYAGTTVAQAFRMAQNAVSLTRQMPRLFLSGHLDPAPQDYQTMNRYMNYYLGMAAVPGAEDALISDCSARIEDGNYILSLTAQPSVRINKAWVVLTSTVAFSQRCMIVDLVCQGDQGVFYQAVIPKGYPYYKAYFMLEGQREDQSGSSENWIEWQEVPIIEYNWGVGGDEFEPDHDPAKLLLDPNRRVIVNTLPARHTFYGEYSGQGGDDIDWIYFYGLKDHIYEIYAQDLSEYGYFIQLSLYDPNLRVIMDQDRALISNNYLAFVCPQYSYYLLEMRLASSYPPEGVEYILAVTDPLAGTITSLLVDVTDPWERILRVKGMIGGRTYYPNGYWASQPSQYYFKFNNIPPNEVLVLTIHEDSAEDLPIATITIEPHAYNLNVIPINLTEPPDPGISPELMLIGDTDYDEQIEKLYRGLPVIALPNADRDKYYLPEGDCDGDGIYNSDEVLLYNSYPNYPTVPLSLQKGWNIFYFPSIVDIPNFIQEKGTTNHFYRYNEKNKIWNDYPNIVSKTFNAVYSSRFGKLYLDLTSLNSPVLCLKGFLAQDYNPQDPPAEVHLSTDLFDPARFQVDRSTLEIMHDANLTDIEAVSHQDSQRGSWESTYRFFGEPAGKDIRLKSFEVYNIHGKD